MSPRIFFRRKTDDFFAHRCQFYWFHRPTEFTRHTQWQCCQYHA